MIRSHVNQSAGARLSSVAYRCHDADGRFPLQRRGGFCEGVRLAGWKVVCAVESDAQACLTHAANFDDIALFKGDIARFLQDPQPGVPSLDELVARKIDVVYGGPPCQGFSQIGPRNPTIRATASTRNSSASSGFSGRARS